MDISLIMDSMVDGLWIFSAMVAPLTFEPMAPNETRPLLPLERETLVAIADCHELKPREREPDAAEELQTLLTPL
ncbi:hypothetical protein V7S43_011183 [Phytophthora oleae]|uniref:Uncharacterized protein n=1 Tax=Phytophthora oleae TaxID=2107226 RepID=A0ABD3FFJ4_9STRA